MATADDDRPGVPPSSTHEVRHDRDGPGSLSETVIEAVAAAEGVDPTDSDLELYRAVDLEALDALFERRADDDRWRFEFGVDDLLVVVDGSGKVVVYEE